jgi:phosphoribosylglycinamide formyltransferase-1
MTGVTVHWVDRGVDTGEIIAQERLARIAGESLEELESRIHEVEHRIYPRVILDLMENPASRGEEAS